jgi:hypothetical protein
MISSDKQWVGIGLDLDQSEGFEIGRISGTYQAVQAGGLCVGGDEKSRGGRVGRR